MPPDERGRPGEKAAPRKISNHDGGTDPPIVAAAAVRPTRCGYLHPSHLTGCRELAADGSKFCARHGGET